jgi:hypothetical protein
MRRKPDYLSKLLEYIDLANMIPGDLFIPSHIEAWDMTDKRLPSKKTLTEADILRTYKRVFKDAPIELYKYVFVPEEWLSVQDKCDLLASLKHGLASLAYAVNEERLENESVNETLESIEIYIPEFLATFYASIKVNSEGFLEPKIGEFFSFIANNKIEARRIRGCVMCGYIYWAYREDSWTCGPKCGNVLRQRIWQRRNKDAHNERRRLNYAYKKSRKNSKEKENK